MRLPRTRIVLERVARLSAPAPMKPPRPPPFLVLSVLLLKSPCGATCWHRLQDCGVLFEFLLALLLFCVFAIDPSKSISAIMCHASGPFSDLCLCHQLFLTEHKVNQSTVQLDAIFPSAMPPLHAAGLAASLFPDLRWNSLLKLSVLCFLVVVIVLATWKWRKQTRIGDDANQETFQQDIKPHPNSGYAASSDILASQPFAYLPPPPGSILTSGQGTDWTPLPHFNSGALAAQATAKLWPDPSLPMAGEVRHPWRRHSHPLSKAFGNDETDTFIMRDADQYFDDTDLNGFWRRRTLVFGRESLASCAT